MSPILANILQPLIDVFEEVLKFFHDNVGLSWGMSIIALTVTIRALLLPLTLKQVKSMQALQRIAPHMKEVQAKYKDDKQRQNQEMMKLYQEHKVNPFASCLPLLAQLPVFISLFYMLRADLRFDICPSTQAAAGAPPADTVPCGSTDASQFFFIPDITDKATGGVLIALIVLYVGTQLASSLLMSISADKNQRMIFLALPFIFIPFVTGFPAGLLVYWITTNTWTIVQQYIVRKTVGPVRPPGGADGGPPDGGSKGPSGPNGSDVKDGAKRKTEPVPAGAVAAGTRRTSAPPPPPGKRKKKRSGRRR